MIYWQMAVVKWEHFKYLYLGPKGKNDYHGIIHGSININAQTIILYEYIQIVVRS